jgi:antitoxin component YwqK of YwqJK toxin-antitoxin module
LLEVLVSCGVLVACGRTDHGGVPTSAPPPTTDSPPPTTGVTTAPAAEDASSPASDDALALAAGGYEIAVAKSWWTGDRPCPEGANLVGKPPPEGREVHCETAAHERHGPQTSFHESGQASRQGRYLNGRIHGLWQTFDAEGRVREETSYLDGELTGPRRIYHDSGKPLLEGAWKKGRPDGLHVWRAADGGELDRFSIDGGDGVYRAWHPNGVKAEDKTLADGEEVGLVRRWYPNGKISYEGVFADGEQRSWTAFDKAGVKTREDLRSGEGDDSSGQTRFFLPSGEVDRVEVRRAHRTVSIVYWQGGEPLAEPSDEALRCSDEEVVKRAWADETGADSERHACLETSPSFPGIAVTGVFANDRGCMPRGFMVDCDYREALSSQDALTRAGWRRADPGRREALALAWLREIALRFSGSILTDDAKHPAPEISNADGSTTVTLWLQHPAGMRRGRTVSRHRYVFDDAGVVQSSRLESVDED